jgi:hypothetical protein
MTNQSSILSFMLLVGILYICGQAPQCFATKAFGGEAAPANNSFISVAEK